MVEHGFAGQQIYVLISCNLAKHPLDFLLDLSLKKPFSPLCGKPYMITTVGAHFGWNRFAPDAPGFSLGYKKTPFKSVPKFLGRSPQPRINSADIRTTSCLTL